MNSLPDGHARGADRVCAVLVTYHPDTGFPERLHLLTPQVAEVIIVDNGSAEDGVALLRRATGDAATPQSVTLLENPQNLGIARALNIGIAHALTRGYHWALLLDQDSEVDGRLIERLLATTADFPDPGHLAIAAARFRDVNERPPETRHLGAEGALWREAESVITSGSFLSLPAYQAIGPFRDEFFIDYVDTEFCLRARNAGYRIIETREALMSHTIGAPTPHRFLGKTTWTTNHSAQRRYYIARNNTVLLRERGGAWRRKSLTRCFRLCKRIVLYEGDKGPKLAAVVEGWWDALRGNMGPRRTRRTS